MPIPEIWPFLIPTSALKIPEFRLLWIGTNLSFLAFFMSTIVQGVVAFELARLFLEKFGGDSLREIERNYQGYLEQVKDSLP